MIRVTSPSRHRGESNVSIRAEDVLSDRTTDVETSGESSCSQTDIIIHTETLKLSPGDRFLSESFLRSSPQLEAAGETALEQCMLGGKEGIEKRRGREEEGGRRPTGRLLGIQRVLWQEEEMHEKT